MPAPEPAGRLILVKHSQPEIDPSVAAPHWHLSDEGRRRAVCLAGWLRPYAPERIVSSLEPKAQETAQIVAAQLGLPFGTQEGLHEHARHSVPYLSKEQFEAQVARFFSHPQELVMGEETSEGAARRFSAAVHTVLEQYPDETLAIVAHGTVISLFIAQACALDPFPLWQSLGLPSFVVLSLPDLQLVARVSEVLAPPLDSQ
jgi:broad specificity phosphatase PhoE